MAKQIPCGRMGKPGDIAHCALFLSSEKASFITGTSVVVDGGALRSIYDPYKK